MKIIKYKKISKNRYKIYSDNEEIVLYEDIILKYNLLLYKDIDIELLDKIIDENKYYESYYLALNYIDTKMRSKKEVRDYLKKKDISLEYIDFAISKLEKLNIFNDESYIRAFINDKINLSNDGPYKIKRELLNHDLEENKIDNYLYSIDEVIWKDKLIKLIDKKKKSLSTKSYYVMINKLKEYLYNLGYDNDMISIYLSKIEYDNSNIEKEYNKALTKYKDDKNKIRNYLLRKGYSYEEINNML